MRVNIPDTITLKMDVEVDLADQVLYFRHPELEGTLSIPCISERCAEGILAVLNDDKPKNELEQIAESAAEIRSSMAEIKRLTAELFIKK